MLCHCSIHLLFGLSPTTFSDFNKFIILPKDVCKQMQWYLSVYQCYPVICKLLQTWTSAITRSVNIHIYRGQGLISYQYPREVSKILYVDLHFTRLLQTLWWLSLLGYWKHDIPQTYWLWLFVAFGPWHFKSRCSYSVKIDIMLKFYSCQCIF